MKAFARFSALALLLASVTAARAADAASDPTVAGLQLLVKALQNYLIPLAGASALTVALLEAFKKLGLSGSAKGNLGPFGAVQGRVALPT